MTAVAAAGPLYYGWEIGRRQLATDIIANAEQEGWPLCAACQRRLVLRVVVAPRALGRLALRERPPRCCWRCTARAHGAAAAAPSDSDQERQGS